MRGRELLLGLALGVAALSGCETTRQQVKPPPAPEEYKLPPVADERYNHPPRFPKGTLNRDQIARPAVADPQQIQPPLSRQQNGATPASNSYNY